MRVLPCGPGAILAEYDTIDEVMAVDDVLRRSGLAGIDDVIPAARTVLVKFRQVDRTALESLLVPGISTPRPHGPIVEIPVVYDGVDLDEVAASTGLTPEQVIETHSNVVYSAAFLGFTPGWAYLVGLPPELRLPRRSTPRTAITAGLGGNRQRVHRRVPDCQPGRVASAGAYAGNNVRCATRQAGADHGG